VEDFVARFGATPTEFSDVSGVVHYIISFLDFTEPYFLFVDMPVQVASNQLKYTYRHKKSGEVLDPIEMETFLVAPKWEFIPYKKALEVLEHPVTKQILRGEQVFNAAGNSLTKRDVLDKITELVWGPPGHLHAHVEDWLWRFYDELPDSLPKMTDDVMQSLDSYQRKDNEFWTVAVVGALLWFKSPHSLRYLTEYHPIYWSVLRWDQEGNRFTVVPYSGGEAVIWNWDVYTHNHLVVEANTPPGTCESCKTTLHCTKYLNATALFHPTCSCGSPVDPEDVSGWKHGHSTQCQPYDTAHPSFAAFVCQRCIQMAVFDPGNRGRKCSRMECPATQCPHHAGQAAYIAHLTNRRRMLLTHAPQQ
jgi:hypothetical protein